MLNTSLTTLQTLQNLQKLFQSPLQLEVQEDGWPGCLSMLVTVNLRCLTCKAYAELTLNFKDKQWQAQ
jgi:hypothetical protein